MRRFLESKFIAVVMAGALMAGAHATKANAMELKVGAHISPQHILSREGLTVWMKNVEERTGGKVKFRYFPAGQAAGAKAMLDAVKNGTIDIALVGALYFADRMPLNSIFGLPGLFNSSASGTAAMKKLMEKSPLLDEFHAQGLVPLMPVIQPPYNLLVKEKRVGMPADWKGLNIRTSGSTQALAARALGGAAVSISGPEVYSALERGRIDAVLFPLSSVPSFNLQEVVKYVSTNGSFGGFSFVLSGRKEAMDKLPAGVLDIMTDEGWKVGSEVAKKQDDSIAKILEEWKKKGLNIYEFTPDEMKAINTALADVKSEWVKRVAKSDDRSQAVLELVEGLAASN